jgi:predicted MFS family arabinose efflux permease
MNATVPLAVWRLGASGVAAVIGFSLLIPYAAIRLEGLGHSATAIGVFSALPWLAVLALAPFIARLAQAIGGSTMYVQAALISAPFPLVFALTENYLVWCAMNFLIGVAAALRWIVSEAWVVDLVPADRRGRAVGMYETSLGFSFMCGPLLLTPFAPDSPVPAFIAIGLWTLSWLLAAGLPSTPQREGDERPRESSFALVLRAVPAAIVAAIVGGAFETGLAGIGAYWGLAIGLDAAQAALIAAALGAGSFLAQYPAGWLADKISVDRTVRGALFCLVSVSLAAPFLAIGAAGTILTAFLWGGAGGMLYTLAMIRVGHGFSGTALLRATAAVVSGYTIGCTVGPTLIGFAMEASPRLGLPLTLAALAIAALAAHIAAVRKKA